MYNAYWLNGILAAVIIGIAISVYKMHQDANSRFNVLDLLMEGGRTSRIATAFMVALVATTWVFIKLAVDGKMTEGYMLAFGGMWVTPIVSRMFATNQVSSSSSETVTTTTSEQVIKPAVKTKVEISRRAK